MSELAWRSAFTWSSLLPLAPWTFRRRNCGQLGDLCPFPPKKGTKEYLPSPPFKGIPFPFGLVVQQTTSFSTQRPNYLNSLWHPKGDLHPVRAPLGPLSHTCRHLKQCHQALWPSPGTSCSAAFKRFIPHWTQPRFEGRVLCSSLSNIKKKLPIKLSSLPLSLPPTCSIIAS